MIKVALKHIVFNQCIDVFFDRVINNYLKPRIERRTHYRTPGVSIRVIDIDAMINYHVSYDDITNSRYAQASEMLGADKYYRRVNFSNMSE